MTDAALKDFATALAEARREGRADVTLREDLLSDVAAAERVRELACEAIGEAPIGFKVGATSPEAQAMFGCDEPFYGQMFKMQSWESGATVAISDGLRGAECEYAFRLGADLPPREEAYSRYDVATAVGSCHPAIELVGRRTPGDGLPPFLGCIADFALNAGFVAGSAIADWQLADLENTQVIGRVDGKVTNFGIGAKVLGHPLNALAWIATKRSQEGLGMKAGDWISTGTCLGIIPANSGTTVSGDFGKLGRVEMRFE